MITNELISEIKSKINDNHKLAITGGVLQGVLVDMVKSLCEVYPQTYTEEEKAQARANIDALSNYDGEITKEKLSLEVQAILNDVANKQNITDEALATIAKTIVGAINEVYKGGLKDASIATSKIEDGAITEDKLAYQSVTNTKIANASVSEEKIIDNSVSTEKLKDGAITEPKLDTDLANVITSAVQPAELASAIATALASYVAKADIVDTTGSATDKVMSQHGVTEAINGVTNKITELESGIGISLIPSILQNNIQLPNIDTSNNTLDLGVDAVLLMGKNYYSFKYIFPNNPEYYRAIPIYEEGSPSGAVSLVFNLSTKRIYAKGATKNLTLYELVIGGFRLTYQTHDFISANLPFEYTIDKEYRDKSNVQAVISKDTDISSHSYQVIGDGDNGIMIKFFPKKGMNYIIATREWAYSELTRGNYGFTYGYYDGSHHDMFALSIENLRNLKNFYNVSFDNDFEYCYVFLRANKGEVVNINISDAKIYEGAYEEALQKIGIGFTASGNELPNINTPQKTLDLGADPVLYVGKEYYAFASIFPNNTEYYRAIPIYENGNETGAIKLIFNLSTKRIYAKGATKNLTLYELVIGGFRLTYQTHDFISANLPFEYTINGKSSTQIESAKTQREYSGERPNLPRYYNFKTLLSFSEVGRYDREISSQGMDIYANKYLFQGSNPKASESTNYNNIYVIDLESKTLLGGFEYKKESHVNTVNCGALYDSSDTYPLLYVSECYYGHGCDVIRLNNNLSLYQSIQRISYVGSQYFSGWTAYDWTIDLENSFIYAFGTNNGFTQILKFALPLPTSGNVEFTDDDILDVFKFNGAYIYQGAKVIGNQIFIPFGFGDTQYPAYMKVFDVNKKDVVSHIPLDGFGETEAVALYKGNLVIVNNSTSPTYREIEL